MERLKSRKFWMAIASIITALAVCLGSDVEPETTAAITSGLFALYLVVQGIIDAVAARTSQ